jgi:RNA polymerase sigma-70 factor (ECF subfamily)
MKWSQTARTASDADIVHAVLGGKRDVYAELVARHQQVLYRHARGMGVDHDTSLDLVQDAFVKAFVRLKECRDPAHFRAWVFRIARNLYLDHLKNVRTATVPLSAVADADLIGHEAAVDVELTATLRAALTSLPVSMREAFLMKHHAGYTYDEVAALTNATPSAVKMRVHRAREALRAFLAERGVYAA